MEFGLVSLPRIPLNYMWDYMKVMFVDMKHKMILKKYLNNKFILNMFMI